MGVWLSGIDLVGFQEENGTFGGFRRFFVYFWEFRVLLGGFHFFRVLLGYQQKIMYLWVVYQNYFFSESCTIGAFTKSCTYGRWRRQYFDSATKMTGSRR